MNNVTNKPSASAVASETWRYGCLYIDKNNPYVVCRIVMPGGRRISRFNLAHWWGRILFMLELLTFPILLTGGHFFTQLHWAWLLVIAMVATVIIWSLVFFFLARHRAMP